jgi:hypothetical protein
MGKLPKLFQVRVLRTAVSPTVAAVRQIMESIVTKSGHAD